MAFSISAWRRWSASSSRVSPLTGVGIGLKSVRHSLGRLTGSGIWVLRPPDAGRRLAMRLPSECYQMQKTIETIYLTSPRIGPRGLGASARAAPARTPWPPPSRPGDAPAPQGVALPTAATARLPGDRAGRNSLFAPLLRWVGRLGLGHRSRPSKAYQTTAIGSSASVSCARVPRGLAHPARRRRPAPGWVELLQALAPAVPENMTVIVLCDRGIASEAVAADTGSRLASRYALEHHFLR